MGRKVDYYLISDGCRFVKAIPNHKIKQMLLTMTDHVQDATKFNDLEDALDAQKHLEDVWQVIPIYGGAL